MCQQREEEPSPAPFIEWLKIDCDISDASVAECVSRLKPTSIYNVYCGSRAFWSMRAYIRNCHNLSSAFSPQVNVHLEPLAKPDEWIIEANDKRVGSHGVPY